MSLNIPISSANVTSANGSNTHYTYNFINGALNVPEGSMMCVGNVTLPYSWFNINSSLYNNNSFQYTFPASTGQQTFTVTLPNGYYDATAINNYLQTQMIANGQYLVNSAGQYVYYMTFKYDVTYYAIQLMCYAVPTSLPSGYTNPANMTFPTTTATPQLIISSSNSFGSLIGYTAGTYPSSIQTSNQSFTSNTTPNGSPVNSLIMRCNLVDNNVVMPSDILDSVPISSVFGSNIVYQPSFPKWTKIKPGRYSSMTLQFVDQNLNAVVAKDPNLSITLMLMLGNSIANPYTKH